MQGFFIHANSSGNFSVTNETRVHEADRPYFKSGFTTEYVKIEAEGNDFTDETVLYFKEDAISGFDSNQDALKLFSHNNAVPQIYTNVGDENFALNSMEEITKSFTVPLNFKVGTDGVYKISNIEFNIESSSLYLEDKLTNTIIDFKTQNDYSFNHLASNGSDRFVLHFGYEATDIFNEFINENSKIDIYSSEQTIYINLHQNSTDNDIVKIYDISGRMIISRKLTVDGLNVLKLNVTAGSYIVKVVSPTNSKTQKVFVD